VVNTYGGYKKMVLFVREIWQGWTVACR